MDAEKRIEIIESRVLELENAKIRNQKELKQNRDSFQKDVNEKLINFQKAQKFFIKKLEKIEDDLKLISKDNEELMHQVRIAKRKLATLQRKLGDQAILLSELSSFFKTEIEFSGELEGKEKIQFKDAFELFKKKKFENAKKAFLKFRDEFQDSKLTDDALYFIGYIQFLKGDYEKASIRFFELIEQHQDSNRLNDSIWWLAVTLERSGDIGSAIDMYQRLLKSNPSGNLKSSSESRIEDLKAILDKRK